MNRTLRGFIAGALTALLILGLAGYLAIINGLMPAGADAPVPKFERWAANRSLHAALRRVAKQNDPLPANDANLIAGIKLYGQNCAVCHGDKNARPTDIAKGLYIRAPQLARFGVEDDPDQVTYWKLAHGIRFTGMPAFDKTLTTTQLWQLTLFLKTMDHLPPAADRVWRQVSVPDASVRSPGKQSQR